MFYHFTTIFSIYKQKHLFYIISNINIVNAQMKKFFKKSIFIFQFTKSWEQFFELSMHYS